MGLANRIIRMFMADLHSVMDQIEDRHLLLRHHLREMARALEACHGNLSRLQQQLRRLEAELAAADEKIDQWQNDLKLAVSRDRDDIARRIIRKLHLQRRLHASLSNRVARIRSAVDTGQEQLQSRRLAYEQARIRVSEACRLEASEAGSRAGVDAVAEPVWHVPSEDDIELELMQLKEEHHQSGRSA